MMAHFAGELQLEGNVRPFAIKTKQNKKNMFKYAALSGTWTVCTVVKMPSDKVTQHPPCFYS